MNQSQPDLNEVLRSPQAAELLKNRQALESLLRSDEARRLLDSLNQNSGGGLKNAAQAAMKGDGTQLMGLVQGLMNDPKSARLVQDLNTKLK